MLSCFLARCLWSRCFLGWSFLFFLKDFFFNFWLCWVFVSVRGLSPVPASEDHSSSRCAGLSLSRPLPLRSTGSRCTGSVVVAHGPSRSAACGILPDQGSNPCPLHWQADSQPLRHQGSSMGWSFLTLLRFWRRCCLLAYSFLGRNLLGWSLLTRSGHLFLLEPLQQLL